MKSSSLMCFLPECTANKAGRGARIWPPSGILCRSNKQTLSQLKGFNTGLHSGVAFHRFYGLAVSPDILRNFTGYSNMVVQKFTVIQKLST